MCRSLEEECIVADKRESPAEIVRKARRAKGLTQSALASLVGCRQSAISMFEGGHADAIARKTILVLGEKLSLSPELLVTEEVTGRGLRDLTMKYCPVDMCPSNIPYAVRKELFFKPSMIMAPAGETTRCSLCGEIMEEKCPNSECGADLAEGSCCQKCGSPYIAWDGNKSGDPEAWAERTRSRIAELQRLSRTTNPGDKES